VLVPQYMDIYTVTVLWLYCATYSLFTWSKQKWLFGGLAFIQPIRAICKVFKNLWLVGKKLALQKSHFCF